ncbi:MAG: hypothetical protein DRP01_03795 [Archaeoglobales archaeon]|nr:MAG: hypothetical protein DRP01_03795 [Archaeoglobales archaeon]
MPGVSLEPYKEEAEKLLGRYVQPEWRPREPGIPREELEKLARGASEVEREYREFEAWKKRRGIWPFIALGTGIGGLVAGFLVGWFLKR